MCTKLTVQKKLKVEMGYNFFLRSLLCKKFEGLFLILALKSTENTYGSDISKSVFLKGIEI